jgi:hypothetical protein
MGMLGKVLAIVNVVAAVAFIVVAGLDYSQRQRWSFACLEQDFQLDGLPVDSDELTEEGIPKIDFVTDRVRRDLFAAAPGTQSRTQIEEVEQRRGAVLAAAGDDVAKLQAALLPLAETAGAREEISGIKDPNVLRSRIEEQFAHVKANAAAPIAERRDEIARVLFATSRTPEEHNRTLAIVGLRAYCQAVNVRTTNCQNMIPEFESELANDRNAFEVERKGVMQQILSLADRCQDLRDSLDKKTVLREQHRTLVQRRKEVVAELQKAIANARKEAEAALAVQAQTEKETFAAQKAVIEAEEKNRQLEQVLRGLENGR